MKDCIARLAAIVVAVMVGLSARVALAEGELSFAIVPQFPALDIHRTWSPIAKALEVSLGQPVQLKIYPSIPEFEKDFLAGVPDLLYLNPYHMVLAQRARGYLPLVRDSAEQLSGILVVQAASKITTLNELQGLPRRRWKSRAPGNQSGYSHRAAGRVPGQTKRLFPWPGRWRR